ncbi:hypothetical protein [Thiolinea disciformis]|uniref:hypothetical protein n=1 Tax=Thiolinea disciformis TaxID=125614 RepID=UPI00036C35F8|nr:hypothetical protein [Thiolinea disciformis]
MKLSRILLSVSLLLCSTISLADSLIGSRVPPYPKPWKVEGGTCLLNCTYNIGVLKKAEQRLLYLGKALPKSNANDVRWQILDVMPYPELPKGYELAEMACEVNGVADPSVMAIVKTAETEWLDQVRFAYKANTEQGAFETISTQGIRCGNLAWGL